MKRKLKFLLGIILAICSVACIWLFSACGGDDPSDTTKDPSQSGPSTGDPSQGGPSTGDPSQGGPSQGDGQTKYFSPVIECEIKSATLSITAGTKVDWSTLTLPYTAELTLYASKEDYQNKTVYSTQQVSGNVAHIFVNDRRLADDTLEETIKAFLKSSSFSSFDVNCTPIYNAFVSAMKQTHGQNIIVNNPGLDKSELSQKFLSAFSVNLLSNEDAPVTVNGNLIPYAFYKYSELVSDNDETVNHITFNKTDFAAFGSYAEDEGFYVRPELSSAITKKVNGVHYSVSIAFENDDPSSEYVGSFEPGDNPTVYQNYTLGKLRLKGNSFSGRTTDSRAMKFTAEDIVSLEMNERYEIILRLKGVGNSDFEFAFIGPMHKVNYLSPQSVSVKIPDMTVAEVAEKRNEIEIQYTYSDGERVTFTGAECDLRKIENVTTSNAGGGASDFYDMLAAVYAGDITLDFNIDDLRTTASYTLTPVLAYSKFDTGVNLPEEYFELQNYSTPSNLKIYDYYYKNYNGFKTEDAGTRVEAAASAYTAFEEQCQLLIDGGFGEKSVSLARAGMLTPNKCDVYNFAVKEDTVNSINVKLSPLFSGIIVGEPVDVSDCFVEITLSHGQQREIPMTADMIGNYSETSGMQDVEVSYREVTDTVSMQVRKVKAFDVEEGLDKYYILNDEPVFEDVWLKVTFTNNETDYVRLSDERAEQISLDLSKAGSSSVTLTFGGVNKNFSYSVIEGVYITYTVSADKITLSKFNMGKPAEGTLAWIPQDAKNISLPEEIEGVQVTATAANLFKGQTIIRTLTVPASITTVGYGLVDGCANLERLTVTGAIPLNKYFAQYKSKTMTSNEVLPNIPQKMEVLISGESLCDDFFNELYCSKSNKYVQKLAFGENILSFGEQSVGAMKSVKALVDGGSEAVYIDGDVIYIDGGATLAYYSAYKADEKFTVPDGVTKVCMTSTLLKELTIPACVTTLGEDFMDNAEELTTVKFAAGSLVTALPDNAFDNCSKLISFNFPENLVSIGRYAMCGVGIERIILPSTVTTIGDTAFNNAKCTHFYLPTGATQSFSTSYTSLFITMNNLQAVAYDGSVSMSKLPMFKDTYTRQSVKLYITGEQTSVGNIWYWSYANSKISTVYVCSEVADFIQSGYSGTVVKNNTDKWWL